MPYTHLVGLLSMARHILWQSILWNHSFWPIFVDHQNLAGSWGRNFVDNWFAALQFKTIYYFEFLFEGNPWNPWTLFTHEHWWFHSIGHLNTFAKLWGTWSKIKESWLQNSRNTVLSLITYISQKLHCWKGQQLFLKSYVKYFTYVPRCLYNLISKNMIINSNCYFQPMSGLWKRGIYRYPVYIYIM